MIKILAVIQKNTEKPLSIIVTYEPKQGINDKTSGYGTKYKFVIQ